MDNFELILGALFFASLTTWLTIWVAKKDGYYREDYYLPAVSWIAATLVTYLMLR